MTDTRMTWIISTNVHKGIFYFSFHWFLTISFILVSSRTHLEVSCLNFPDEIHEENKSCYDGQHTECDQGRIGLWKIFYFFDVWKIFKLILIIITVKSVEVGERDWAHGEEADEADGVDDELEAGHVEAEDVVEDDGGDDHAEGEGRAEVQEVLIVVGDGHSAETDDQNLYQY